MSKINGLHEFNFGVIFLILTYFVSKGLLQKYNTCQPPPPGSKLGMILALLTRVATCVGPKSWHGSCMGQHGATWHGVCMG